MKSKNIALRIAGTIFGIVALMHLARVIMDIRVIIGEWEVPMVASMIGMIGAFVLCIWLWLQSVSRDK